MKSLLEDCCIFLGLDIRNHLVQYGTMDALKSDKIDGLSGHLLTNPSC